MRELSSEWLRVDGHVLYVEPFMAESNARGDVFLAGRFNFLGDVDSTNHWRPVGQDGDFLGAYLPRHGLARVVRSPFPDRRLDGFRAIPEGDSAWTVVFGERLKQEDGTFSHTASALWSARYDGHQWSSLEPFPPIGAPMAMGLPSSLVRRGDTLFWALVNVEGNRRLVFQRTDGSWHKEAVAGFAASVELGDGSDLALVTVAANLSLPSDANSLWLWERRPRWTRAGLIVPGGREEVFSPVMRRHGPNLVLAWTTPRQGGPASSWKVRAMIAGRPDRSIVPFTVDSASSGMIPYAPLSLDGGRLVWVTDHRPRRDSAMLQVSVYDNARNASVVLGRFPHDYLTPSIAVATGGGDLLVSGGHYETNHYGVSELRRFRVTCVEGTNALPRVTSDAFPGHPEASIQ